MAELSRKSILMIDSYRIREPQNTFEVRKKQIQERLPELFREQFPSLTIEILFDGEEYPETIAQMIEHQHISYVFSCIGMKTQEQRLLEIFAHIPDDYPVV